jgi:RNA polymerase sigma-70 factor (ECF subfamily)
MERIADGDALAFRKLSDEHLQAIVTFSHRLVRNHAEAEDIAQETFLRVWQKADSYQPKAKVSTWFHTIARNIAIDRMRKRSRREEAFEIDDERDASPDSAVPSQLLAEKRTQQKIERALSSLPERQRSALALCHEEGLNNQAIAEIMSCSVEAVESLLSRGRRTLREIMSQSAPPALTRQST